MSRYYYDLHIHSCLSPCADNDSTPANIAGMAALNGLGIVALTDHNATGNCPAFCEAARRLGLIPIPGMELTTAEDIHVVCLFPTLDRAMAFGEDVGRARIRIRNKPALFGDQRIVDADDNVVGEEPDLLINATILTLRAGFDLARQHGGIAYPAHIDRPSNGIIATLGDFPTDVPYTAYELKDAETDAAMREKYPAIRNLCRVVSSDSHELGTIAEQEHFFDIDDEPYSSALVIERLFRRLGGAG